MNPGDPFHVFTHSHAAVRIAFLAAVLVMLATGVVTGAQRETAVEWFGRSAAAAPTPAPAPAFTGEYVDGVPVYRLPPLTVVANRPFEVAAMTDEDRPQASAVVPSRVGRVHGGPEVR